jgi:NADH:ubiquinone oxidoreductase subunit 5 (subunit L)/multisubunit Na+/H+ antiporter MnhA subunit
VRSALRAFATYRLCDAGFLLAIVTTHELLGSTRLSALDAAAALPRRRRSSPALFLLAAMGKSAQLPFSGWLPRAMEGPTPSSALFYGGVSLHAGLFLLLRTCTRCSPRRSSARSRSSSASHRRLRHRSWRAPTPTPRAPSRTPRWRRSA